MRLPLLALMLFLLATPAVAHDEIPRAALKWRSTIIREVRYWWGMEEPRDTFASQIHQESRFNEEARSPVGAEGMAQFMPGTSAWVATMWPKDLQPANALDPRWAIRACIKFDKWLWDKFPRAATREDRFAFTMASYNSGLGWAQKEARLSVDSSRWYDSTENVCLRRASACAESRGYVRNIWFRWRPLYAGW
jgi:soluble lytic murein transglycosylase-like protein